MSKLISKFEKYKILEFCGVKKNSSSINELSISILYLIFCKFCNLKT